MERERDLSFEPAPAPEPARAVDDPRVYLAAERTYLAWVRTSLGLMGFGFLIARFGILIRGMEMMDPRAPRRAAFSPYIGFSMVCFGVVVCGVAAVRHQTYVRRLRSGVPNPPLGLSAATALAAVLAAAGLAMAIHILMT